MIYVRIVNNQASILQGKGSDYEDDGMIGFHNPHLIWWLCIMYITYNCKHNILIAPAWITYRNSSHDMHTVAIEYSASYNVNIVHIYACIVEYYDTCELIVQNIGQ